MSASSSFWKENRPKTMETVSLSVSTPDSRSPKYRKSISRSCKHIAEPRPHHLLHFLAWQSWFHLVCNPQIHWIITESFRTMLLPTHETSTNSEFSQKTSLGTLSWYNFHMVRDLFHHMQNSSSHRRNDPRAAKVLPSRSDCLDQNGYIIPRHDRWR